MQAWVGGGWSRGSARGHVRSSGGSCAAAVAAARAELRPQRCLRLLHRARQQHVRPWGVRDVKGGEYVKFVSLCVVVHGVLPGVV
jgi:hypothetical protein